MQTLEAHTPMVLPRPYALSIEKYHAMVASGALTEDDKVELLDGQLNEKMPINPPHADGVYHTRRLLERLIGDRSMAVYTERPVSLPPRSVPEPDVSVVDMRPGMYPNAHPTANQVHLLVEVADETLRTDRKVKMPLYALAGIKEYWILNLTDRQLERFTEPKIVEGKGAYAKTEIFASDAVLEHERFGAVEVSQLLPPQIAGF